MKSYLFYFIYTVTVICYIIYTTEKVSKFRTVPQLRATEIVSTILNMSPKISRLMNDLCLLWWLMRILPDKIKTSPVAHCDPPTIPYSKSWQSFSVEVKPPGVSLLVNCKERFVLLGEKRVVCESGTWSTLPTCKKIGKNYSWLKGDECKNYQIEMLLILMDRRES